jgi:5-(carboxyamino)imidazole ribonucleotide synthase
LYPSDPLEQSSALDKTESCPSYSKRVGIVGGGQLGRMLALAAHRMGIQTQILANAPQESAAQVSQALIGNLEDPQLLGVLAKGADVLTVENEWVDGTVLAAISQQYNLPIWPHPQTLSWIQDKYLQRKHLEEHHLPVPIFHRVETYAELLAFAEAYGPTVVLKTRTQGYDGQGTAILRPDSNGEAIWNQFARQPLMVEQHIPFERELAVLVARAPSGQIKSYPVVETQQVGAICHTVLAPAAIPTALQEQAAQLAQAAVEAVQGVGITAVELFQEANGKLWINELAPRPHNSGHFTIEGCVTSQFEQHLRAILDWPLGSTALVRPVAVMVNILGEVQASTTIDPSPLLALEDVHFHWYGKAARPGRKLGHITVLGDNLEAAYQRAWQARKLLKI